MLKVLTTLFSLLIVVPAFAAPTITEILLKNQLEALKTARALDWKPGDTASYNVDMGFISGTMVASVTSNDGNEIWLAQDMNLSLVGEQKTEILMDANTGTIKQILVNGQEQEIPDQGTLEVVQIVDATITVPAGTFKCTHATLKNESNEEINIWASGEVPMSGMIKQVSPNQFGTATVELTSFNKQ